jgi:NSS family neurotransmitter:Na+ symporter
MVQRESWATRIGFLAAAVGSAVGLGNIWQFPFKTASNGGAAFLIVYLLAVVIIGVPTLLAEFVVGRRANRNVIGAFDRLGHRSWTIVGALGLAIGFWILSYYSVVGGWIIRYTYGSATGAYFGEPAAYFGAISSGPEALGLHFLFMALTVAIVAVGIEDGIERATKVMVPTIVVLLVGLGAWAATLPDVAAGYEYFLSPDLAVLQADLATIVPFAVGQAFFSLSLGMGIMITYASYLDRDDDLARDGVIIVLANTAIGLLAGLVVFPLLFAQGVDPATNGPNAIFVAMATAFGQLPAGRVLGVVFFGVVLIAALSSSISLLEVVVSYVVDRFEVARWQAAGGLGGTIFLLGVPSAWDTAWLGWFDALAYQLFLPVSVLFVLVFVSIVFAADAVDELEQGLSLPSDLTVVWLWTVRLVVLAAVLGTLYLGVTGLRESGSFVPPL